ncbi:hypothetical protein AKJ49_00815 [candidate division MSBL1 archaeon SCGC-AAA382A03]|uniref:Cupin type-2 domain-containing protein n=1 Tax=candidate division MSBL1 archaeon SCGC-AAA382A03 TaxID=1698278 RepID=A0A133VG56_9EURY|nr:hypothetical protein AKJ49_00815 [candidate division MSBL1 archaeon SCGC-AAA382A03]
MESSEEFKPHKLIQKDEVEVVLLAFEPGQGLPVHETSVDVFFHVIKGEAAIKVGEDEKNVSEGNIVLSPADIPHTVRNESDEEAKILVVKTPQPGA